MEIISAIYMTIMGNADLDCHGQGHFHPMNNLHTYNTIFTLCPCIVFLFFDRVHRKFTGQGLLLLF